MVYLKLDGDGETLSVTQLIGQLELQAPMISRDNLIEALRDKLNYSDSHKRLHPQLGMTPSEYYEQQRIVAWWT